MTASDAGSLPRACTIRGPVDYFFANKATLLAKLDDATLERAEKLFARINALLP